MEPPAQDTFVARRRRIIEAARDEHPGSEPEPLNVDEAWQLLRDYSERFLAACEGIDGTADETSIGQFCSAFSSLDQFKARLGVTPKLRPFAAMWRAVEEVVALADEMADRYLRALQATTPDEAQSEAEGGQDVLDRIAARLDRFAAHIDEAERLQQVDLGDEWGDVVAGAQGAFALAKASDIVSFDRSGIDLYERIAGSRNCPDGFGIRLQLMALVAEAYFDPRRFWQLTARVYALALSSKSRLSRLAHDRQWQEAIVDVGREARDAGYELAAVTKHENRRRELRAAIRFGHITAERLAPPHLATLCALRSGNSFEDERRKSIATLLNELAQTGHGDLTLGIDRALRHGDAHRLYEIEPGGVRFTAERREYDFLTDEQLIDRVLLGFESLMALNIGITAALPEVGLSLERLEELTRLDVPETDMVRLALSLSGWTNIECERRDRILVARGERSLPGRTGIVATLTPYVPRDIQHLVLEVRDEHDHRAEGPVEPFRRWANEQNDRYGRDVAFLEALGTWKFDSEPGLSIPLQRKLLALHTLQAFDDAHTPAETMRRLRILLDATKQLNLPDVNEAVANALRLRRESAAGRASSVNAKKLVATLESWTDHPAVARATW